MQIVSKETICTKCQSLFILKNKKKKKQTQMSSAEMFTRHAYFSDKMATVCELL